MKKLKNKIIEGIKKGEGFSPFLFTSTNLEITNAKIHNFALEILEYFSIPKIFLYKLEDTNENVKISEIRNFIHKSNTKSSYSVQIFFIENISRLTTQASNSLLKFLEEPGKGNLIFLSNTGENNILETILSRVQVIQLGSEKVKKENLFFQDMIKSYVNSGNIEIISYFFKGKFEKTEYIDFLENIIMFAKKNMIFIDKLDEILEDIHGIEKNNLNARYIVDKWILKIGSCKR